MSEQTISVRFEDKKTIVLDKEINVLDRFVAEAIKILEKHTSYVIVSGYVSILFARTRATDDVDIIIERISKENLKKMLKEFYDNGYWCLNTDDIENVYDEFLTQDISIRIAKKGCTVPNIEIKFPKNKVDELALTEHLTVKHELGTFFISPLELQISYKNIILGSYKDKEDALHIERVFKGLLNKEKIKYFDVLLNNYAKRN